MVQVFVVWGGVCLRCGGIVLFVGVWRVFDIMSLVLNVGLFGLVGLLGCGLGLSFRILGFGGVLEGLWFGMGSLCLLLVFWGCGFILVLCFTWGI